MKSQLTYIVVININLHWSEESDTPRLRYFMEQMLKRVEEVARNMDLFHPYLFLSHCYEDQRPLLSYGEENLMRLHQVRDTVDPEGIFQLLQVGQHKLGMLNQDVSNQGLEREREP